MGRRMSVNENKSWNDSGYINPYGFVALAEEEPERKTIEAWEAEEQEHYTGKIVYRLETLSPLFIPDTSNKDGKKEEEHKTYEFFSYGDGKPIIPGSEVRGMVRSLYETFTNSCVPFINEKEVFSKRTPEYFKPGILQRTSTGYKLVEVYETADYLYRENNREDFSVKSFLSDKLPQDGSEVYFNQKFMKDRPKYVKPFAENISLEKEKRKKTGYLLKGEFGPELAKSRGSKCEHCPSATKSRCVEEKNARCYLLEKHCAHIFTTDSVWNRIKKEMVPPTSISVSANQFRDLSERMKLILKIYEMKASDEEKKESPYQEYQKSWERFLNCEQNAIPLYFSKISKNIIYVSPAKITREVYMNTLVSILEKQGKHQYCDGQTLCPACALFGTVQKEYKRASKLRFSDMLAEEREDYYEPLLILAELSSPKVSTAEFYLQKPEDDGGKVLNWTYEYYILMPSDGKPIEKIYMPKLAGRKFYWHSPDTVKLLRSRTIEKNKRNKTVRPVKKKVAFVGEVYFEGISKKQLDGLIAVLNLSKEENGNKKYAAKLGAAKPLGLGSVGLSVEKVWIRKIGIEQKTGKFSYQEKQYEELFSNQQGFLSSDKITVSRVFEKYCEPILKFLDMNALKGKLAYYPYALSKDKKEEGFRWFSENRKAARMGKTGELDLRKADDGPKSRKQTIYHRYMEPANPELRFNRY